MQKTITKQVTMRVPASWNKEAQYYWLESQPQQAIQTVISQLNEYVNTKRPADLMMQLSYYLYLNGDRLAAAKFLEVAYEQHPDHPEIIKNLAVTLSSTAQDERALSYWDKYLTLFPNDYVAYDAMCMSYFRSKRIDEAKAAGAKALWLKDQAYGQIQQPLIFPADCPQNYLTTDLKNVISFSLWGNKPRYLRGAIDNALARFYIYPDWVMRFYVDESVPKEVCDTIEKLGGEVVYEALGQTTKQKLAWRFKVANDPTVGRFLVRDIDSVVNSREKNAVEQWIKSDKWFHIMRDWWSHTDLILAGMWGGIANILPQLDEMLANYTPQAMETPNIDQWFLRDKVWSYVKQSCLIHDRFFKGNGHQEWQSDRWQENSAWHVGQDIHAVEPHLQAQRLYFWMNTLNSLR